MVKPDSQSWASAEPADEQAPAEVLARGIDEDRRRGNDVDGP